MYWMHVVKQFNMLLYSIYFEGGEENPVIIPPHGNAKDSTAYRRTQEYTIKDKRNGR